MSQSPVVRKLQTLEKSKGHHVDEAPSQWPEFLAIFSDPDLPMIIAFCLLGLLLTLSLMLRFPDLRAVIEQYKQFWPEARIDFAVVWRVRPAVRSRRASIPLVKPP